MFQLKLRFGIDSWGSGRLLLERLWLTTPLKRCSNQRFNCVPAYFQQNDNDHELDQELFNSAFRASQRVPAVRSFALEVVVAIIFPFGEHATEYPFFLLLLHPKEVLESESRVVLQCLIQPLRGRHADIVVHLSEVAAGVR